MPSAATGGTQRHCGFVALSPDLFSGAVFSPQRLNANVIGYVNTFFFFGLKVDSLDIHDDSDLYLSKKYYKTSSMLLSFSRQYLLAVTRKW